MTPDARLDVDAHGVRYACALLTKAADALLAALASKGVDPESNDVRCKVADAYMMGVDEGLRVGKKVNSTAAPVEAAPGKYVPKVGDVVTHVEYPGEEFTIQSVGEWGVTTQRTDAGVRYDTEGTCGSADNLRYLRDSTDAEKRAAGLAVPPPAPTTAPEAKRPTVDSAYDRVVAVRDYLDLLVSIQPETRRITAALAASIGYVLPAPCPPPVAGSAEKDEAFKALLAAADDLAVDAGEPFEGGAWGGATLVTTRRLNVLRDEIKAVRALSRPVRP